MWWVGFGFGVGVNLVFEGVLVIEREIGVDFERGCLKVLCDWKRNRCCV
jgi:hypothetical protein